VKFKGREKEKPALRGERGGKKDRTVQVDRYGRRLETTYLTQRVQPRLTLDREKGNGKGIGRSRGGL